MLSANVGLLTWQCNVSRQNYSTHNAPRPHWNWGKTHPGHRLITRHSPTHY